MSEEYIEVDITGSSEDQSIISNPRESDQPISSGLGCILGLVMMLQILGSSIPTNHYPQIEQSPSNLPTLAIPNRRKDLGLRKIKEVNQRDKPRRDQIRENKRNKRRLKKAGQPINDTQTPRDQFRYHLYNLRSQGKTPSHVEIKSLMAQYGL